MRYHGECCDLIDYGMIRQRFQRLLNPLRAAFLWSLAR